MEKIKTRKCALRGCGKEFTPSPYWQKYHSPKCSWTARNKKHLALIRRAQKIIDAEEKQANG